MLGILQSAVILGIDSMVAAVAVELRATAKYDGWQTFAVTGDGLPPGGGVPFALTVTYTATQELSAA